MLTRLDLRGRSGDDLASALARPEPGGDGPLDVGYDSGTIAGSAGHYVASAGWMDSSRYQVDGTGVLYPNSRVGLADVNDGTSATLMVGERSPYVAEATWTGTFGSRSIDSPRLP